MGIKVHVTLELDLDVEGTSTPIVPAKTYGPPEDCYPEEGGEVEIEKITCSKLPTLSTDDILELLTKADKEEIEEAIREYDDTDYDPPDDEDRRIGCRKY